jgi:transcriptional regulator with XRE-family HTH domain
VATPKVLSHDIGDFIRDLRQNARISLRQLAEQAGVSNPYLSQIERGLRKPSADVLQQLAKALRISAETLYVRAGILDPDENSDGRQAAGVVDAVLLDPALNERQKRVLLDVYTSFVRENAAPEEAPAKKSSARKRTTN